MAKTDVGRVELLDEFGDAFLEHRLMCSRWLRLLDPVDQPPDQDFQLGRHILSTVIMCFESVGEDCNPALERGQNAGAGVVGDLIDLARQGAHFFRQLRQCVVRSHVGEDAAHCGDGAFELLESGGVGLAPDLIHLLGELLHHPGDPKKAFGRGQAAQRITHFSEPALDRCKCGFVGAGVAGVINAVGQFAHLVLERFDRCARHRLPQRQPDFGEFAAQRVDRLVEAARWPQRINLPIDLAQPLLERGPVLRAGGPVG